MNIHPLAGQPASPDMLVNVPRLVSAYYTQKPDPGDPTQGVAFGTSGHRGSSLESSFNEDHILAICQAICELPADAEASTGPLYLGMDTHALSEPAHATAIEVFAANGVDIVIQAGSRLHAYAGHLPRHPDLQPRQDSRPGRRRGDHAVAQPSGRRRLQIQPARGRPGRYRRTTRTIQDRANAILEDGLREVKRMAAGEGAEAQTRRTNTTTSRLTCSDLAQRRGHAGIRRQRAQDRGRSAGRGQPRLLGPDRRDVMGWTSRWLTGEWTRPSAL